LTETALDFIHGLPSIVEVAGKSGHILAAEGSSEIPREFPDPAEVVTKEMPRPPTSCGRVRHNVSKRTQRAGRDIDSRRLRHSTDVEMQPRPHDVVRRTLQRSSRSVESCKIALARQG
jgi:hypothetical protein